MCLARPKLTSRASGVASTTPQPAPGDRDRRKHVRDAVCRQQFERLGVAAERHDEAPQCSSIEQPVRRPSRGVSQQPPIAGQTPHRIGQLMADCVHAVGADSGDAAARLRARRAWPASHRGSTRSRQGRRGDEQQAQ